MSILSFHDGSCCHCGSSGELYRFTEFGKAVCPACYPLFFQRRIASTLRRYSMVRGGDRIAVALSGGKDSAALLHSLWNLRHRLHVSVVGLHVDMGLGEYSEQSLQTVRELVEPLRVPLVVERVADHGVRTEPAGNFRMCSVCGAVRRALLDRIGLREGFTAIATGHTLDDRLQQMLKRLLTGRLDAPRPILPGDEFHPRKIKPLSFVPDRASKAYVDLLQLPHMTTACPQFAPESHRLKAVFELLEELAPMGKSQLVNSLHKAMKADVPGAAEKPCPDCGNPTGTDVCPLCRCDGCRDEFCRTAGFPARIRDARPEAGWKARGPVRLVQNSVICVSGGVVGLCITGRVARSFWQTERISCTPRTGSATSVRS